MSPARGASTLGIPLAVAQRRLRAPTFWRPNLVTDGAVLASSSRPTVTATASATPHTKGAWTEVTAATSVDISILQLVIAVATGANLTDTSALLDIGIGPSGSEVVVASNLAVGYAAATNLYMLPLFVPAGSRIAVRVQGAVASQAVQVRLLPNTLPHTKRSPTSLVTMGANTATSRGVSIPGAAVNTKSAWTEITSAVPQPLGALMLGLQGDGDTAFVAGNGLVDVGIGAAGSEVVVLADYPISFAVAEQVGQLGGAPIAGSLVPAGSRLAVRWARDNTGNSLDAILYGAPIT